MTHCKSRVIFFQPMSTAAANTRKPATGSWLPRMLLIGAVLLVSACQHHRVAGVFQGGASVPPELEATAPQSPATTEESTQNLPASAGPSLPAPTPSTQTAVVSESESEWRKMLEPYLKPSTQQQAKPASQPETGLPPLLPLSGGSVRVGMLLPLSGPTAPLGQAMLNAAQMAMFDFADTDFELLPHDTAGRPEDASFAATMVIGDGANLLVGPLLAHSVHSVAPISQAAGVPVIGFSSDRTVAGKGIYTMGFLPENEVERVVTYALGQGLSRFAVLAPNDAYGATVVSSLSATVSRYGGAVVDMAYYHPSGADIEPVVKQLADYDNRRKALLDLREELEDKEDELSVKTLERLSVLETLGDLPFDALLIADGGDRLQRVAAMLPFFDIDPKKVRILGTGQWDVPGIGAEPALLGAWFAAPPPEARRSFEGRYRKLYGVVPPRLATLAYDAMALAAVLARKGGEDPYSAEAIMLSSGYAGRDGIFRFTQNGTAERGLSVLEVGQRQNRVIDEAPKGFQSLTN